MTACATMWRSLPESPPRSSILVLICKTSNSCFISTETCVTGMPVLHVLGVPQWITRQHHNFTSINRLMGKTKKREFWQSFCWQRQQSQQPARKGALQKDFACQMSIMIKEILQLIMVQ